MTFMDLHCQSIVTSSPNLVAIAKILREHRDEPAVIMTSFPEITLVIKKLSRYLPLAPIRRQQLNEVQRYFPYHNRLTIL